MEPGVIYARVSTDEQRDNFSLRNQIYDIEKLCEKKNIQVILKLDDDHSAKNFDRPEFKKFLNDLESGKLKCSYFVFYKMDRFSRNMQQTLMMFARLKAKGVKLLSVQEGEIDFDNIKTFFPNVISAAAAQFDNMQRAENTTRGMMTGLAEGKWMWKAPYGYKNVTLSKYNKVIVVDDKQAEIVKFCFEQYATGLYTVEDVRKMAKEKGLIRHSQPFTDMLKNPFYKGWFKRAEYRNEPERMVQGVHKPIISEELFNEVQALLNGKKKQFSKTPKFDDFPLRGGYLICPKCNKPRTGSFSKKVYPYYHCQDNKTKKAESCGRISTDIAHEKLISYLKSFEVAPEILELYNLMLAEKFQEGEKDTLQTKKSLENEIAIIDTRLNVLTDKYIDGLVSESDYKETKIRYEKQRNELIMKHSQLPHSGKEFQQYINYSFSLLGNISGYYSNATTATKRKILSSIFPENLIFENGTYRTPKINAVFSLLLNTSKDFSQKKAGENANLSCLVAPTRIELVSKV